MRLGYLIPLHLLAIVAARTMDLSHLFSNIKLATMNMTLSFKNARIENGIMSFDNLDLNGNRVDIDVPDEQEIGPVDPKKIHHPALARSIDRKVNPCDDFYSFVCNGWIKENKIPADEKGITQTKRIEAKITKQLKEFITKPEYANTREQKMMQIYYGKCVHTFNVSSEEGMVLLLDKMRELRSESFYLTDWLLSMYPETILYDIVVLPDDANSSMNMLNIVPSSSMQPFNTYFDPAYASEYVAMRQALFDFLKMLAIDDIHMEMFDLTTDEQLRRVENLLRVDQTMAKIQQETEFNSNTVTVPISELSSMLGSIDWIRYLTNILPPMLTVDIGDNPVTIKQAANVHKYEDMLMNLEPQVLADYLDWKVIFHYAPYLGPKYTELLETYNKKVYGVETKDRTRDCVDVVVAFFSDVLGELWIEKHFDYSTIPKVTTMVKHIRDGFLQLLKTNDWMDENTKESARAKAHAIVPFVGFDANIYKPESIKKKFANIDFNANTTFYDMQHSLDLWMLNANYEKLVIPNRRDSFDAKATETNAFYDPSQNQIAILAGILQDPFFNTSWPEVMNLAAIGMVIGHEITHGFDDYGAYFDSTGNRVNWWTKETFARFEQRRECIEKQYDNITVMDGVRINGRRTEGENIADNGGMRSAIRVVFNSTTPHNFVVQGLEDFTAEQVFFMTYGFTWCGNMRPHTLLDDLATDSHSPSTYRVNTVLSNQPQFAQSFKCPIGSKMNPQAKCTVW